MKNDLSVAINYFDLYAYLSKQDLNSRFRRSFLGVLWIVIQQLAFSLIAGLMWARIFSLDPSNFIPFLTIGFATWGVLSTAMTEGCGIFIIAQTYLKQLPLPQSVFIFRALLTSFFYLFVGIMTAIFVLTLFNKFYITSLFYALPGISILLLYSYGANGMMAYLGLRYRDLQHALSAVFSLLFIVTPVIYPPAVLVQKGIGMALYMNPFASLIEIIRFPLLNSEFADIQHYGVSAVFALLLVACKFVLSKKWGRFVPFWV
jgi:ABC-type polysaccharide/polyol phosphate export permease